MIELSVKIQENQFNDLIMLLINHFDTLIEQDENKEFRKITLFPEGVKKYKVIHADSFFGVIYGECPYCGEKMEDREMDKKCEKVAKGYYKHKKCGNIFRW